VTLMAHNPAHATAARAWFYLSQEFVDSFQPDDVLNLTHTARGAMNGALHVDR